MKPPLLNALQDSKSIVIMLPKNPYFDQVAAALSLYLSLKSYNPTVVCDTPMTVEFNRLIGVDKIVSQVGNKNLAIKVLGYPASQVERVKYDIDGEDLLLVLYPLPGFEPPTKDSIQVNYTGVSADTVILIGGANDTHFPLLQEKDFMEMKLVHIGVSDINLNGKTVLSLAQAASCISEVVSGYLLEIENVLNPDIATNLFAGLSDGTRNFGNSTVTARTFQVASQLLEKGARREQPRAFQQRQSTSAIEPQKSQDPNIPRSWVEPKIYKGTSAN